MGHIEINALFIYINNPTLLSCGPVTILNTRVSWATSGVIIPLNLSENLSDRTLPQWKEVRPTLWFLFIKLLRKVHNNAIKIIVFIIR